MSLLLGKINIRDVQFAKKNGVKDGVLFVKKEDLIEKVSAKDPRLNSVRIEIARPGEKTRIIPVKDIIEPRINLTARNSYFPGVLTPFKKVDHGKTNALKGISVVTCGQIIGAQEGILDMSGPGAEYSLFSKLINVVVTASVVKNLEKHQHEETLRLLGLRTAAYIAKIAKKTEPNELEIFEKLNPAEKHHCELPRVVYIYPILSQGLLHDTYIYGVSSQTMDPIFIQPTEIMNGAVISGNCVSACDKNMTYHHQNNAIIRELYGIHRKKINFSAVILTPLKTSQGEKDLCAQKTADLIALIRPDGAILSKEGFGNPDADFMSIISKVEEMGVKTVGIVDEFAGSDGASQSLADAHPSADAIISTGNANELVILPPMEKTIGDASLLANLAGGYPKSLKPDGSIEIELQAIIGATNQLGFEKLLAKEE